MTTPARPATAAGHRARPRPQPGGGARRRPSASRPGGVRSGNGGFTLIEVLVALAIVAVTLAAGLRAAASLADNAARLAAVSAAQWCADNQLAALRLARQWPGVGDADLACEQLGRRYAVTLRTRPTPNPNFRRVDALVADDQGQPLVTLSTVLGRY